MNVTAASNAGELRRYDPRLYPRSILLFHVFGDVFILNHSSLSAERRRASQRGWPVWRLTNTNPRRVVTVINLLLSLEKAESSGPDALEHRWADAYLLVCHLDASADGSLSAASHVAGKHHFHLERALAPWRTSGYWKVPSVPPVRPVPTALTHLSIVCDHISTIA